MALMGFGDFNDMFGHVDRMINNIMRIHADPFGLMPVPMPVPMPSMSNMAGGSFVSSSVVISNDGTGRPQVYQATRTARYGPGGVAETTETVKDSASGVQKMAIGHHINDRGHVMEKSKNWYTGEEEEKDELINLEEEEQQTFENEWKNQMYSHHHHQHRGFNNDRAMIGGGQGSAPLAITAGPSSSGESNSSHYYPQQIQHPHQHQHQPQQWPYNPPQQRAEVNASNSRCDPDIEILTAPGRPQGYFQQPIAGSSQQSSSRYRVPSKQRGKKDKKPYKRSSHKNAEQH